MALIDDASDAYFFIDKYLKYSFVTFLNIFSSCQFLHIDRFVWDTVLSSSYDGWDQCGY